MQVKVPEMLEYRAEVIHPEGRYQGLDAVLSRLHVCLGKWPENPLFPFFSFSFSLAGVFGEITFLADCLFGSFRFSLIIVCLLLAPARKQRTHKKNTEIIILVYLFEVTLKAIP